MQSNITFLNEMYRIYWNKRPLPINHPLPSSLPLQSSYFGVLHPSQQPTLPGFRKKMCFCTSQANIADEK